MFRYLCCAAALATAAPALAETVVPPAAFEALATGRTLHFTLNGRPFGAEQFFPGRRSLWRYADATCEPGIWAAEGAAICFDYGTGDGPICWHFVETAQGYAARLLEDDRPAGLQLELDRISDDPLPCPGPEVGS